MADGMDQDQEQKGGGLAGVTTGAVLGATGAGTVAHFGVKPEGVKKELDTAKGKLATDKGAYDGALDTLKKNNTKAFDEADAAKTAIRNTESDLQAKVSERWYENLKGNDKLAPEEIKEISIKGLEAQKKVLAELPKEAISDEARGFATKGIDSQIKAVKAAENNAGAINEALGKGWADAAKTEREAATKAGAEASAKFETAFADAEKAMPGVIRTKPVNDAFAAAAKAQKGEVAKGLEASILAEEPIKTAQTAATNAVTGGKAHIDAWAKIEEGIKDKKGTMEASSETVKGLEKRLAVSEEKGFVPFFTKPFKLMKSGSTGQKLAIAGATVGLLAAGYMGVKAYRNRDRGESSYADQITQQREAAAAAEQSAGAAR